MKLIIIATIMLSVVFISGCIGENNVQPAEKSVSTPKEAQVCELQNKTYVIRLPTGTSLQEIFNAAEAKANEVFDKTHKGMTPEQVRVAIGNPDNIIKNVDFPGDPKKYTKWYYGFYIPAPLDPCKPFHDRASYYIILLFDDSGTLAHAALYNSAAKNVIDSQTSSNYL